MPANNAAGACSLSGGVPPARVVHQLYSLQPDVLYRLNLFVVAGRACHLQGQPIWLQRPDAQACMRSVGSAFGSERRIALE